MTAYEQAMGVITQLFSKDYTFVLATSADGQPSARVVDTYYEDGVFWVVTFRKTNKMNDIEKNPRVALCNHFHTFKGIAQCVGHPLQEENKEIRKKLIKVFEPWYFAHNDEGNENMCFVKIKPETGVFHLDGTGYKVDFLNRQAETFPFAPDIEMIS